MINKTILPNGLKVITEYLPDLYSATVTVFIDAGSVLEDPQLNGLSHFIEHMFFKGTSSRTSEKIVEDIEDKGGSINAYTEKEHTCIYAKVLSDQVPLAIDVLLDMVLNSLYDLEDIELERQVILEEVKMYEDTPDELVHDLLMESLMKNHPLGRPITGTYESISNIKRDDIIDFINNFYTMNNITISIAGNFDERVVLDKIYELTNHIKTSAKAKKIDVPIITPEVIVKEKEIEQAHICMGTRGISVLDKDRYATAIIDICLGGGMTSRLFKIIREKYGLVYSINTYEAMYRPSGIFGIYAAVNPENLDKVIRLIKEEIDKFKTKGLSDNEFQRTKTQLKGGILLGLESTKYRASKNGRSELYFNKIHTIEEINSLIDNVTQADIKRLSDYIFDDKYMGISLIVPKGFSCEKLQLF